MRQTYRVTTGDIREWVKGYKGPLFHAVLTDPPYNLESIKKRFGKPSSKPAKYGRDGAFSRASKGFMGKEWDTDVAFDPEVWYEIGKLLYPGSFGLAFMGSRTYHKCAMAIEEAGFVIHPMIGWIQSQGFPKATRIDKQVDKKLGLEQKVVGKLSNPGSTKARLAMHDGWQTDPDLTEPSSDLAKDWAGHRYGLQALKPCLEPIVMFQRPYEGKPLGNMVSTGAGALNIEGTKYETGKDFVINRYDDGMKPFGNGAGHPFTGTEESKRFPSNVILSEFDEEPLRNFFYNAKVNKKERDAGLTEKNPHPTLKPIQLNQYLATLLLPPKRYSPRRLLVPYAGAGSEIIGALLAGWDYVEGIELEAESTLIAEARIKYWLENEES